MLRARPGTLALLCVSLVIAVILGVQMGHSAIADINPIHFQGPLERPQAVTPPPEPAAYDPYGQSYIWSMGARSALTDCGPDCDTTRARQAMRLAYDEPAGRDPALPVWRDATPATELRPWTPGALPNRGLSVERYMHYPVNREQRVQAEAALAPAAAPVAVAAEPPVTAPVAAPAVED
jgi:hypothetical protein